MNLESLQNRRTWVIGGVVIALLIVVASWSLIISPKMANAASTRTQVTDNDVANTALVARGATLARQEKSIASLRTKLAAAMAALPATSALPEFTHEATKAATTAAVTLQNINIGTLAPVTSTAAATATSTTSTATASTSSTAAQYQLSITLTTIGPIKNQLAFVRAIENGPRRALLSSTAFSGVGNQISLTSQLNIFTAPMSTQQLAQLRKLLAG